jgi:hypothetical protein
MERPVKAVLFSWMTNICVLAVGCSSGADGVSGGSGGGQQPPTAAVGGFAGQTTGTAGTEGLQPPSEAGGAGGISGGGQQGSGQPPEGGTDGADGSGGLAAADGSVDAGPLSDAALDASSPYTGDPVPETGTFPPVTDLLAAGPFQPVTVTSSGPGNSYTVYHPAELAPGGVLNPFLTWGNGIMTTPDAYTLLPHLASHGFVVIASNSTNVTADDLRAGLYWLFAENERQDSVFYHKLDTSKVASMGYSLGSDCTFKIADDPRLTTTVHISGGAFDKAETARLRNPAAFFYGDEGGDGYITGDVAHANCDSDFEVATVPVFYGVFNGGGHLGIMMSPYMELIREAVTGWLRWKLMADRTRSAMFVGSGCELCTDPGWTVQQKNL